MAVPLVEMSNMKKNTLRTWETLSKEIVLQPNKFLCVENHTVKLPDSQIIPDWSWITIPDAVIVLPRTREQKFLCFRQTKYAIEGVSLAPVGGMIEMDENPLEAAKRELLEEMGYMAPEWINLGSHILDPNRGIATIYLFLALDAYKVAEPNSDDLEDQELLLMGQDDLEIAYRNGEFRILSWSAVVAMSLNYLMQKEEKLNWIET